MSGCTILQPKVGKWSLEPKVRSTVVLRSLQNGRLSHHGFTNCVSNPQGLFYSTMKIRLALTNWEISSKIDTKFSTKLYNLPLLWALVWLTL